MWNPVIVFMPGIFRDGTIEEKTILEMQFAVVRDNSHLVVIAFRATDEAAGEIGSLDSSAVKDNVFEPKFSMHTTRNATGIVMAGHIGVLHNEVPDIIAAWVVIIHTVNPSFHMTEESVEISRGVIDRQVADDVVVSVEIASERTVCSADGCPVSPAQVEVAYQAEVFAKIVRLARVHNGGYSGEEVFAVDDVRVSSRTCVGIVVLAVEE